MDLNARIRRRKRTGTSGRLVVDYEAISPVSHQSEPVGRGPDIERLLDYLDPAFGGNLPPNAYVCGPAGSGKSAVVTALFEQLAILLSQSRSVIHTTTRAQSGSSPSFVYVDARNAASTFALYHEVLSGVVDETVPRGGIGTESIRDRLTEALEPYERSALVAVDHVGESETKDLTKVRELLAPLGESIAWVAIGRLGPDDIAGDLPPERIEFAPYERHEIVDIVTERASTGLARRAIEHEETRQLATWAEGNAHDALAALFGAAVRADDAGQSRIHREDFSAGMDDVPRPSISLGRVLALSDNRKRVLRALVELGEEERESVDAATAAIVASDTVDLSETTVKRFLYELAEVGITERVTHTPAADGIGRPPSRVEPRFPPTAFKLLYDLQVGR